MLIYILQEVLQGYEEHLEMEDKVHATILNRSDKNKTGQKNNKRARNNNLLNNAISPLLKSNHDRLGALTLKNVVLRRFANNLKKQGVYMKFWEIDMDGIQCDKKDRYMGGWLVTSQCF